MNKQKINQLIAKGYDFDIEEAFKNGWELFKITPLFSVGYTAFIISLELLFLIYFKEYAVLFSVFLAGPLFSGFYLVANKLKHGDPVIYPDFFHGFRYYIPIILIWLIGQVLVSVGILLLVIPGVYLLVGYCFAILLHIFAGLDFWESMEYSRRLVTVKWWKFFLFILLLILINLIGILFFVGVLVTIPFSFYVAYCAFEAVTEEVFTEH
ncbi:hypothetical protein IFO69_20895 [Echinicola sp. CAU 1574]|uniref:DUF975 family protein n=1 Tax=Echinicola arenosa TaxID=2774144 RepID=A0ABR9AUE2_9BACT|nr:hypothetical protein [Echinicola arenosa]MBD8491224.1 hypothetical protein [Echinicola arenosa]